MTQKVFMLGYSGRKAKDIKRIAEELDAVVFDIRYSPRSRNPEFSGKRLRELLAERYQHTRALGNLNYRGGPIALVDFDAGLEAIRQSEKPVILMCVCKDPAVCHRTTIAGRLRALGFDVTELSPTSQLKLRFGGLQ